MLLEVVFEICVSVLKLNSGYFGDFEMVASRIGGVSVMKGRNPLEVRSVEIKVSTFWF